MATTLNFSSLLAVLFMPCFTYHNSQPCPFLSISNVSRPRSLAGFCQLEIITSFFDFSMIFIWTLLWHQSCAAVCYTDLYAQWVSLPVVLFSCFVYTLQTKISVISGYHLLMKGLYFFLNQFSQSTWIQKLSYKFYSMCESHNFILLGIILILRN